MYICCLLPCRYTFFIVLYPLGVVVILQIQMIFGFMYCTDEMFKLLNCYLGWNVIYIQCHVIHPECQTLFSTSSNIFLHLFQLLLSCPPCGMVISSKYVYYKIIVDNSIKQLSAKTLTNKFLFLVFPMLYSHMFSQRKKVLAPKKKSEWALLLCLSSWPEWNVFTQ